MELRELSESYWPNEEVLRRIGRIELHGTVGPSAVGKSLITKLAIEKSPDIHLVLSDVSRQPRGEEKDGVDYFFRSKEEMMEDIEKRNFVQIAPPTGTGKIYATRPDSYPESGIATLAIVSSAVPIFRRLPFKLQHHGFIVPNSYDRWQDWFQEQAEESNWSAEEIRARKLEAAQSYAFALDHKNTDITFILNDDKQRAAERFIQMAHNQLPDDHAKARWIAAQNYQRLKDELG